MLANSKKRLMTFTLLAALLLTILPGVAPAMAEGETMTMKQLNYSIWPEYDKAPEVLVIYSGTFVNDTGAPFDGELRYKVPKNAEINMVCETEQGMTCQRYVIEKDNPDYDVIVWKPSHAIEPGAEFPIMMEYYYKPFEAGSNPKAFTQTFRPGFPVTDLTVEVKAPKGASEVVLTPQAQSEQQAEGFANYYYQYANLTTEDAMTFDISYVRESNEPSVEAPTQGDTSASEEPQTDSSLNSTIVILLVVFILLLAVFIFFAINNNNQNNTKTKSKKKGGSKKGGAGKKGANNAAEEKRKLRKMLIDGKISEETYQQLLEEIDN